MPIDPQNFMLYWAGGTLVVLILLFRRPKRPGMRLRLLDGSVAPPPSAVKSYPPARRAPSAPRERSLNVVFNYNGHSWDAHEVLGVAAGSNLDSVRAAFTEALETVDPTSRPFVEAAYRAIVTHLDQAG